MNTITPVDLNKDQFPTLDSMMAHFYEHFKVVVANTHKLQEEVYKIRYQVYCQELGYELEEDCPNGMEQDIFDQRSVHCLLLHRASGHYAGCVRLVLPELHEGNTNLPFERVYGGVSESNIKEVKNLSRHSFGEVSRLAVTAEFRKRSGEAQTSHGVSALASKAVQNDEKRHFSLIAVGLYLAATSVAIELGLESALSLMEPRLARHLRRFGIEFHQIGEFIEFHGQRGLFQVSRSGVLDGMNNNSYKLFQLLSSDIKKSLSPSFLCPHHSPAAA